MSLWVLFNRRQLFILEKYKIIDYFDLFKYFIFLFFICCNQNNVKFRETLQHKLLFKTKTTLYMLAFFKGISSFNHVINQCFLKRFHDIKSGQQ